MLIHLEKIGKAELPDEQNQEHQTDRQKEGTSDFFDGTFNHKSLPYLSDRASPVKLKRFFKLINDYKYLKNVQSFDFFDRLT